MAKLIKNVVGLDNCKRQLAGLASRIQKSALRKGMTAVMTPVLQSVRAKCPVREPGGLVKGGLTRKSLGKRIKQYKSVVAGICGARRGFRRVTTVDGKEIVQDPVHTLHLVEFGTAHSKAKPFLRPALDANRSKFMAIMAAKVQEEIAKTQAKK